MPPSQIIFQKFLGRTLIENILHFNDYSNKIYVEMSIEVLEMYNSQ